MQGGDFHPSPARALFVVLPADSRLEVEAMVSNRAIGSIRAGQRVEIKVDTFNFIATDCLRAR
jgi:hemolysin D